MPSDSTKPSWIEPPPPKRGGMGCFGKGFIGLVLLVVLFLGISTYIFVSHGSKPKPLPIEELPPEALSNVQDRVAQFKSTPPLPTPSPVEPTTASETPAPVSPSPTPEPTPERQLVVTAGEINGMISANPKSRGHAFVALSGNTAQVQISIPSNKVPGFSKGYLNGTFVITTDGPTPISALQVSKISANGIPFPSGILSASVGGHSIMGYAMDAIAPYNVSTAEIRDGNVILH